MLLPFFVADKKKNGEYEKENRVYGIKNMFLRK